MQGVSGNWNLDPPRFAVAHMVGALAKQTTFKSLGWWQYGAEVYRDWGLSELERELDEGGALAVSGLRVGSMYGDPAEAGSLIQLIFFYPTVQKPLQLHRCRRCFKGTSHPPMNDRI